MFLDLQINGCWGVDFNRFPITDEDWDLATKKLFDDGTHAFLPTIITDSVESIEEKLQGLAMRCNQEASAGHAQALGIHLEGPFLSPELGYIGAHPKQFAIPADLDIMKRFEEAAEGWLRYVTLAPEMDPSGAITAYLAQHGILVAAGHTDASVEQIQTAIDAGLRCVTHLGNGCPSMLPRHDNILHRIMRFRDSLFVTLIADGYHLPWWLLKILVDWFGDERSIVVSDAISAAGLPSGYHSLGERQVWVDEDGVPRSEDRSHFVGSGATLGVMQNRMLATGLFEPSQVARLLGKNPTKLLTTSLSQI